MLVNNLGTDSAITNGNLSEVDRWVRHTEVYLHNVRLSEDVSVDIRGVQRRGTHDIHPGVALPGEVERSCLQAWEHFDEVVEEAHLRDHVNSGHDPQRFVLTKSVAIWSSS